MKMLIVVCKINLLCLSVNYKLIFPSTPDILLMPQHVMSATKPSLVFVLASNRTVDREGSLFTCNPMFILFKIWYASSTVGMIPGSSKCSCHLYLQLQENVATLRDCY